MKNIFKDLNKEVNDRNYKRQTLGEKTKKANQSTNQNLQKHTSNGTKINQNPKQYKFRKCHHSLHNEIKV